jgi:hypothetical protein
MTATNKKIGYLYVNGLGDGKITIKDTLVYWWWGRADRTIEHAGINWYDGGPLSEKMKQVEDSVDGMLKTHSGVVIIGGSAGGSLALNVFFKMKHKNVCVVTAHARVRVGNYSKSNWMSLYRRAKLDTEHSSQAFYDSVVRVDSVTIPSLTTEDKDRLLNLTQLTDMVVALDLMKIEEVQRHRSLIFGHSGGFLAHLVADRDLITNFAEPKLLR